MNLIPNFVRNAAASLAVKSQGLYEATRPSGYYDSTPDFNLSHDEMIDLADLETMRSAGREIYSNFALVAGAVHERATTATGQHWLPIYYGKDAAWGKLATEWLKEYFKVLDARGQPHTFVGNQWTGSKSLDVDGEYFILPLINKATGWPSFQYLDGHAVGSRFINDDDQRFPGLKFTNGIWRTKFGRPVAYRLLADDPADDRIVKAKNIIHVYDPKWFSQGRGVPSIIQGILDWKDVKKFRENTKTAANVFSSLTVVEKNTEGKADTTRDYFRKQATGETNETTGAEKNLVVENYLRGAIRYIKSGGGNDIQAFKYDTPPHQVVTFIDSILRGGFSGMDWPIEQAYDMSGLGTAQVRAITNKCQRSTNRRQHTLNYPAARKIKFALAAAANGGFLPTPPVDWYKWGFAMPPKMTTDAYREAAQDREDYKIGFITMKEIFAKRGEWWVDHIDQAFDEELYFDEKSNETGITVERVRMLTPNGNAVEEKDSQDQKDSAQDKKDSKTKQIKKS